MGASRYLIRVGVLGVLMLAMVALSVAVATAAATPDASCDTSADSATYVGNLFGSRFSIAQTFTALDSGRLTGAEVRLSDENGVGTLVMEIRSVDGTSGKPSANVLASAYIPASDVPDNRVPGQVRGHFSPGTEVVAGQQYALVLRSSDGLFLVRYNQSNPCSGMLYTSTDGGASFGAISNQDMLFTTFVDVPPEATDDSYSTAQSTPLRVAAPGLLSNDSDPAGDPLTAAEVTDPAHGEVFVNANGSFAYFPDEGYLGADSFTYKASDGVLPSDTATVEIAVKDATKPTITSVSPRHRSTIKDNTPTIRATVKDNIPLAQTNVKLYVAGRLISATKFSYAPSTGALVHKSPKLSSGKKTVKIVATDAAGNALTKSWYFNIKR